MLSENSLRDTIGPSALLQQIIFGLTAVFVAPFIEELITRGIILQRLAIKWNLNRAIIISSLFFGILHGDDFIGIFMVGVILAVLYVKTKSLVIPIILHMINNAIAYGLLWVSLIYHQSNTIEHLRSDVWIGLTLTIISLPGVLYYLWKNWPKSGAELPLTYS